jgi:hypothetical protein
MRTALFWTIMQQVVVITYRHFGTTSRSQIQKVVPKYRQWITTTYCIINQMSAVLLQTNSILQKPWKLFFFFYCIIWVKFNLLHSHIVVVAVDDGDHHYDHRCRNLKLCIILNMNNFCNCKLMSLFRVPLSLEVNIRSGQPKKLYLISVSCRNVYLSCSKWIGSEAHLACYLMGTGECLLGEADHSIHPVC